MVYPASPAGGYPAAQDTAPSATAGLLAYWRVVVKHKWGILGLAFAFGLLATLFALSLEPVYEAESTLLLDTKRTGFSPVQNDDTGGWLSYYDSQTYLQTQLTLFESRLLAEKVAERLALWTNPELDPRQEAPRRARLQVDWAQWLPWAAQAGDVEPIAEPDARRIVAGTVQAGVSAEVIPDTEMVVLRYQSGDPELAARIVREYADAYIEMGLETRLETVQKAATWLTGRLEGLRKTLEASERKLQEYRETYGLVDLQGGVDLTDQELSELSDRLAEARAKRTELESLYQQVGQLRGQSGDVLAVHPIILNNPTIQTLKAAEVEAEREASELAKRYGPKHPKMIAADSDLRTVRDKLDLELDNAVAAVKKELAIADSRAAQLEEQLGSLKSTAQEVSRKEFGLQSLERDVETNRQLYEMFLTRFKETDLGTDVESTNARVIDVAQEPGAPIKPRKARIVLASVLVSLLLGVGLAFLLEHLDNTFKTGAEVEEALQIPLLGTLPLLKGRRQRKLVPERVFVENPKSDFAEAIRTLRTGVVLAGLDDPHRVVLVTSSVPGEGKTTVATNLAIALGQLEEVLLVDADMRRASVGTKFGLAGDAPGLSNLVAGTAQVEECIHSIDEAGIDIMPAGVIPPNPLELLSSLRFGETIQRLGERYGRIVIDSAPAQAVSDALVLSKLCNAVVFVVKADDTPVPVAELAARRLGQVDAHLVGAVLNRFDSEKAARYGYYGQYRRYSYAYQGYSQYYGDRGSR
jgi:capsular exopolysaccharide synthesis family protein